MNICVLGAPFGNRSISDASLWGNMWGVFVRRMHINNLNGNTAGYYLLYVSPQNRPPTQSERERNNFDDADAGSELVCGHVRLAPWCEVARVCPCDAAERKGAKALAPQTAQSSIKIAFARRRVRIHTASVKIATAYNE